ncbi:MAG TPA: hypothetical protein VGJ87_15330 [Roseiflexaceae bacterium]
MDREQAFRILRTAGFTLEHVGGDRWKVGMIFPEVRGTPLEATVCDERWLIGFAERFYHAYLEFVSRRAAALLRATLEQIDADVRQN